MELNWDGVIGKRPSEPHSAIHPGESVHKIALFRIDVFGTDVITTLTATVFGRACKGDGDEREEDSEGDREAKNHVK